MRVIINCHSRRRRESRVANVSRLKEREQGAYINRKWQAAPAPSFSPQAGIQRNARHCQADITIYVTRVEIQLDILHSHLTTRVVSSARREGFRGNLAALCFIWRRDHIAKRTAVYIDGFNLYFGALAASRPAPSFSPQAGIQRNTRYCLHHQHQ